VTAMRWREGLVIGLGLLVLAALAVGYARGPRLYDYGTATVGGPYGWPVFVEQLIFDGRWRVGVGILGGGFEEVPPRGGKLAASDPRPVPKTLHARWFSHRTQTYYEIDLTLPEDLEARVRRWYRRYPPPDYLHFLVTGIAGDGRVYVWWSANCIRCPLYDHSQDFYEPLIPLAHGRVVEGDPNRYRAQIEEYRREGVIP